MRHVPLALLLCACSSSSIFGSPGAAGGQGGAGAGGETPSAGGAGGAVSVTTSSPSSSSTTSATSAGGAGGEGGSPVEPECDAPADCPGVDDECGWRACSGGLCGMAFAVAGAPVAAQVAGDCYVTTCDGAGAHASVYTPADKPSVVGLGQCVAGSHCTPAGPVIDNEPPGTWCTETCGCPELNGNVCGASSSGVTCTQGLCNAGTCVDAIPVTCKVGAAEYTRCNLMAGANRISWGHGTPECSSPGVCACSALVNDVGYCEPGTVCYVYDANGVWLGQTLGTGVCL